MFGSLTLCHPLSQIRLNSRGLIYSVGLLLASVFVTVGLRLSPLSSPHLSPHPLGFSGYRVCLKGMQWLGVGDCLEFGFAQCIHFLNVGFQFPWGWLHGP